MKIEVKNNKIFNDIGKNKSLFIQEFKSIQFAEITPQIISGNSQYDKAFFKQLDILENKILDGQVFEEASKENNLKIISIKYIDASKKNKEGKIIKDIPDDLFKKIYTIKKEKSPEIIKIKNKYFLAEIKSIKINNRPMNDPEVLNTINAQLNFQNKIENNTSIMKDISLGGFNEVKIKKFAADNKLELKEYKISSLKQNEIFSEGIIKRIFLTKDGEVDLITDSTLTKNFLILAVKTEYDKIEKTSNEFEKYEAKARLNLVNKIYRAFDENLNQKYKVELNKRTIDRLKNSF